MSQVPAGGDAANTEKSAESAEQGVSNAGTEKSIDESTSHNRGSYLNCLLALAIAESSQSGVPAGALPDVQIAPPEQSAAQAQEAPAPINNAESVIRAAPPESDKTKDVPQDVTEAKQAEIKRLEDLAHTPGTALYNAIQKYYRGTEQNDDAGLPNVHHKSPHGFPETSPDRQEIPGLQNSAEVRPGLYRGANPGGSGDGAPWDPDQLITNMVNLKYDQNVNTVVSFEEKNDKPKPDNTVAGKIDAEEEVCKQLGINFYNVPLDQSYRGQALADQAQRFLDIVNQPGVVAYGHCREGIDRTGYLMAQAEMNPPKDTSGADLYPAKSAQEAAQDQVNHGYGQAKRRDYTNLYLPGANYEQADAQKNWTEKSK